MLDAQLLRNLTPAELGLRFGVMGLIANAALFLVNRRKLGRVTWYSSILLMGVIWLSVYAVLNFSVSFRPIGPGA